MFCSETVMKYYTQIMSRPENSGRLYLFNGIHQKLDVLTTRDLNSLRINPAIVGTE